MRVVLAGAYGHLGSDIFRALLKAGHEVIAADAIERNLHLEGNYVFKKLDVTDQEALKGLCDGADEVITTVGLTKASKTVTNFQIDYQGNLNLLKEAQRAGVKHFTYISVHTADQAPENVPIVYTKYLFEKELRKSGISYTIIRPTGYFYDIINVFRPMIEKGTVSLLGNKPIKANVIDTSDLADFIVKHMGETNTTYDIGGKEVYTYEEMAEMCFKAAGKPVKIKHYPAWIFDMLAWVNKLEKNGKEPVIRFSKWTLTHDMVGDVKYGEKSFAEYVKQCFAKETD